MKHFSDIFKSSSSNDVCNLQNVDHFELVKETQYTSPAYGVFSYLIDNYVRTNKLEAYSGDLYWDANTLGEMTANNQFPIFYTDNRVKNALPFCLLLRKYGTNHFEGVDRLLYFCKFEKLNKSAWVDALVFQPEWETFTIEHALETPRWKLKIYRLKLETL